MGANGGMLLKPFDTATVTLNTNAPKMSGRRPRPPEPNIVKNNCDLPVNGGPFIERRILTGNGHSETQYYHVHNIGYVAQ